MHFRHARGILRASLTARAAAIAVTAAVLSPIPAATASPVPSPGRLSANQAAALAQGQRSGVIVLLRNQHADTPATKDKLAARKNLVKKDQTPFLAELKQVKAANVKSLVLINGFSAQVTKAEAARLAADPAVLSVTPDREIPKPQVPQTPAGPSGKAAKANAKAKAATPPGICPADPSKPLLEPEALQLSHTAYDDPSLPQASKLATGKGVKVGIIADSIDVNNPEFVRADGSHVFVDYQNFVGNGDSGSAVEHFGDASSIAAQGRTTYDLSDIANPNAPLPKGCTIRIRGMAPDVSLVGLNVFGGGNALNSTLLQAIDYAVTQGNVDVLNESFGFQPMPETTRDTVMAANDAAVAAGVSVSVSSGDQGPEGTVGSPADDPHVIDAAGSTAFRVQQQLSWDGAQLGNGHWASGQISAFSSGGVTPAGRTPDVVATAERGWIACSKDTVHFTDCVMRDGKPTNVFPFGGTSESAPLISGESALVIQAYKQAHHGQRPTPALIKQLITSTATDLNEPADEQGAGQFNALAAVKAALSYADRNGSPKPQGDALVLGKTQLADAVRAGGTVHDSFTVTNTSNQSQQVSAHGRTLGAPRTLDHGTVTLDTTQGNLPTFFDQHFNSFRGYVKRTFTVPAGVDYLALSAAYPAAAKRVTEPQMALYDPQGTFTAQGYHGAGSGFTRVDVHNPAPGTWTIVFSSIADPTLGFKGDLNVEAAAQNYQTYGTVSPATLTLKPGQAGTFKVQAPADTKGGDLSAAVQLDTPSHQRVLVPFTVRTIVTAAAGGDFGGTFTGGNNSAVIKGYYLDVPAGKKDLSVGIKLDNPDQTVQASLVDPTGQPLSFGSNVFNNATTDTLQLFREHPQAGRWFLGIQMDSPTQGDHLRTNFTGRLQFDTVSASASGLPSSAGTTLPSGKPVTVQLQVTNTGNSPALFFADGRLQNAFSDLAIISPAATGNLPLANGANIGGADQGGGIAIWPVPTRTTGLTFTGTSTTAIALDATYGHPDLIGGGNPDYYGTNGGNTATIKVTAREFGPGTWNSDATAYGPRGSAVVTDTVNLTATAHTATFDPAFTASTGDVWLKSVSASAPAFAPVTIEAGKTGTIPVTITPSAPKGTVVHGTLYVDTFNTSTQTGDELIGIPYSYTVG